MMRLEFKAGRLLILANPFGGKLVQIPKKNLMANPAPTCRHEFKPLPYPQTPKSAARWFKRHGVCKSHWAQHFGFERTVVEHLLRGKLKGRYGQSHAAAIKLGLKENPDGER